MFQYLLFWLVITSGAALLWPAEQVGFDPFRLSVAALWAFIVVTMFSLGTLVRANELIPLRRRPWWVVLGLCAQVFAMPIAAWLATKIIPMPAELAAGVILVGCVPGAMASNVLTHTAGGSVAFSVTLTTVATLLSPITVPAVLAIVTDAGEVTSLINPAQTSMQLFLKVVLPTVLGFMLSQRIPTVRRWSDRWASMVASVALLWIIASVVAANRERLLEVGPGLAAALLMINLLGYAAGYTLGGLARLPSRFRRALTLEVGMQNAGLGTALAASMYGNDTIATIATAAYTFGCMLTGTILAMAWRSVPSPAGDEPL